MRVATWNVNSIKAHLEVVLQWLREAKPDVVCLQEIKCEEHNFPAAAFEELNYSSFVNGQKTYNGVAILSKRPLENLMRGLPGGDSDDQARYLQGDFIEGSHSYTIGCLYLPNGNPVATPKYAYKLTWMERLTAHAKSLLKLEQPVILAGDYNVIPSAMDAKNPSQWVNDALFLGETRRRFHELAGLGMTDAFRALYPAATNAYTFYDYQAGAWQKRNGIRIDHMMLSPQAADLIQLSHIDGHVRGWEKPSDHVPLVAEFGTKKPA